jgi:hypothetical protein
VTLSACDTCMGPVGEAGVVNLVNACVGAGSDSVVSTLWERADQPTSRLMKTFYGGLADHERKCGLSLVISVERVGDNAPIVIWSEDYFRLAGHLHDANSGRPITWLSRPGAINEKLKI